jgi:hypothetical protein
MGRRIFFGGAGGRKGYSGGFGTGGITPVDFLGVVANQAAMLALVGDKGDWCIRSDTSTVFVIINTPSSVIGNWQELAYPVDPSKVLASATDPTPDYLDGKTDDISLIVFMDKLRTTNKPVLSIYDNSITLPPAPSLYDRYIAGSTANGWTVNRIYEWNGAAWIETVPYVGMFLFNTGAVQFMYYGGLAWAVIQATPFPHAGTHDAGGADGMAIDAAAATGSLRTIGTGSLQACAGDDARLSDSRTPTAHAFGGALHSQDSIANIQGRLSSGKLITTDAAEIFTLSEKSAPSGTDLIIVEDSAAANVKKKVQLYHCIYRSYLFYADQLLSPNNADWPVNALAPASADSLNNALIVRRFDDTTEEGVGFTLRTPDTAFAMRIKIKGRAQTAPVAPATVIPLLYWREVVDNAAIGAWSAAFGLTPLDIPTNTNFQYDGEAILFSTIGFTAGRTVQFELTRNPADTLTGDWCLLEIAVEFA